MRDQMEAYFSGTVVITEEYADKIKGLYDIDISNCRSYLSAKKKILKQLALINADVFVFYGDGCTEADILIYDSTNSSVKPQKLSKNLYDARRTYYNGEEIDANTNGGSIGGGFINGHSYIWKVRMFEDVSIGSGKYPTVKRMGGETVALIWHLLLLSRQTRIIHCLSEAMADYIRPLLTPVISEHKLRA